MNRHGLLRADLLAVLDDRVCPDDQARGGIPRGIGRLS
jgi:hypothetical protein